jgi:dihydrofolate reductase
LIRAILACDDNWGIGKDGDLPWPPNPADLKWFKECTMGDVVVMGRKTWESLPVHPLPGRVNYVITSSADITYGYHNRFMSKNLPRALLAESDRYVPKQDFWIIGGAQLVESCFPIIDEIWLSRIAGTFDCDVALPEELIKEKFLLGATTTDTNINIEKWIKDSD